MTLRASLLLALSLALPGLARAQTAADSAHTRSTAPQLDSLSAALTRYCGTKRPSSYVCATQRNLATVRALDSALVATVAPTTTPPDTATPPDTVTPPDTTTPPATDTATFDAVAELPRNVPPIPAPPPCATTVRVLAGTDLQAAINAATPGTCLLLPPGATWVGNVTLPAKSGTGYVTLRTDVPRGTTRVTPTEAATLKLAKLVTPNNLPAISTAPAAHHYYLADLEVTGTVQLNAFVSLRNGGTQTAANVPHDIWGDRLYVHGTATLASKRGVWLDVRDGGLTKSWIADVHMNGEDAQCVLMLSGAKRVRIEDNHCEGSHEPILVGGGDPADSTLQPSDVVLRRNHIIRPASWKGVWQAKNLVELKNVRRMLIEGNVLENCWPDAQDCFAILVKAENQDGTAPWSTSADVTVRYNRINRAANGVNVAGHGTAGAVLFPVARLSIHDNLFDQIGYYGGTGVAIQLLNDVRDPQLRRNTFLNGVGGLASVKGMSFDQLPTQRLVMDANVLGHGQYGIKGSGTGDGIGTLDVFAPGYVFTGNAIVGGGGCTQYPATTTCPSTPPAPSATLGHDAAKLDAMTAGVVVAP